MTPTTPMPMEINPRKVFERMFGQGGTPEERQAGIERLYAMLRSGAIRPEIGQTFALEDAADAHRKVTAPLLALWGGLGTVGALYDVLATWREKAVDVRGRAMPSVSLIHLRRSWCSSSRPDRSRSLAR